MLIAIFPCRTQGIHRKWCPHVQDVLQKTKAGVCLHLKYCNRQHSVINLVLSFQTSSLFLQQHDTVNPLSSCGCEQMHDSLHLSDVAAQGLLPPVVIYWCAVSNKLAVTSSKHRGRQIKSASAGWIKKKWKRVNRGGKVVLGEVEISKQVFFCVFFFISLTSQHFVQLQLPLSSPQTHRKAVDIKCCLPAMCHSGKTAALTVLQWDKPYRPLPVFVMRSLSVPITEVNSRWAASHKQGRVALPLALFLFSERSHRAKIVR